MFSVALILLLTAASCVNSLDLIQPDSVVVQPGQTMTIICQVSGYSLTDSSYGTAWIRQCEGKPMDWIFHQWGGGDFYQNNALKNKFIYSRETSARTVTIKGQNVQPEDTAVYYCARLYSGGAFDYWGKGTTVTVSSATPKGPAVFPLIQCGSGAGNTVTFGCLATDFTPSSLTYKWTKNGVALTDFIQYPPVQKNNFYTGVSQIQVSKQDWENRQNFSCIAEHVAGNGQAVIPLPHNQPPQLPTLKVFVSNDDDHSKASFACFADNFSPKVYKIKWLRDDVEIPNKAEDTPVKPEENLFSVASFLTVPSHDLRSAKFTCLFEGKAGSVNASTIYPPTPPHPDCSEAVEIQIIPPTMEDMFLQRKGTVICQVWANKPSVEKIYWENKGGKEMASHSIPPPNGSKKSYRLSLDITYDEWSQGVEFYCVVEHTDAIDPIKKLYERIPGRPTQRPSVFMMPPVEETRKELVTLTCYVKGFFPEEVYVSWLVDDEEAGSTYKFSTTAPVKDNDSYFVYGHLSLTLDQWKNSDVVYSCVVYHESLVNSTKAIVRSIGYRTFEKTNLVNLNMNIPESCKPQ